MTRALHGFGFAARRKREKTEAQYSVVQQWSIGALVVLLLVSAFSVIYLKDFSRRLFIDYQNLQRVQQVEEIRQSKLLLEEGAWSSQARIQSIAAHQLGMVTPAPKKIIMIRE